MIRRRFAGALTLPRAMRPGVAVVVCGGALDVLYHAAPHDWLPGLETYLGHHGSTAHLVTLAGMVLTMFGLFAASLLSKQPRAAEAQIEREVID